MIKTSNMYFASFVLTEGLTVCGAELVQDPRFGRSVSFQFKGPSAEDEQRLELAYETEQAITNIRKYLDNLVLVRDIMHRMMKNQPTKTEEPEITRRIPKGRVHAERTNRRAEVAY